jgi:hypothetical protein
VAIPFVESPPVQRASARAVPPPLLFLSDSPSA